MNTIREDCRNVLVNVVANQKTEENNINYKSLGDTLKKISSSSFIKGVTDFLQGKYYIKDIETRFNEVKLNNEEGNLYLRFDNYSSIYKPRKKWWWWLSLFT